MEKKIFKLAGFDYSVPAKVGAGLRARYSENLMRGILESAHSKDLVQAIATLALTRQKKNNPDLQIPEDILKKNMTAQVFQQQYMTMVDSFVISSAYTYRLLLLETLLTPCEGSPSVKDAFDMCDESEAQIIETFFGKPAPSKTSGEPSTSSDSAPKNNQPEAQT